MPTETLNPTVIFIETSEPEAYKIDSRVDDLILQLYRVGLYLHFNEANPTEVTVINSADHSAQKLTAEQQKMLQNMLPWIKIVD